MKLLHVTDLHFQRAQFDWVGKACVDADLLCITGDFLDDSLNQVLSLQEQVLWIRQWAAGLPIPMLTCSGNHDWLQGSLSWVNDLSVLTDTMGIANFGGLNFGCIPYDTEDLAPFAACDVLLHHEPPAGLKVAIQAGQDFGSRYLQIALQQQFLAARWILSGHVHRPMKKLSKFKNYLISNPGANHKHAIPDHHWIRI